MTRACASTYFLFATGIENGAPRIQGGRVRVDRMALCHRYDLWRTDFDLVDEIGRNHLRYGLPLYGVWKGAGWYVWSFTDETFGDLYRRDHYCRRSTYPVPVARSLEIRSAATGTKMR